MKRASGKRVRCNPPFTLVHTRASSHNYTNRRDGRNQHSGENGIRERKNPRRATAAKTRGFRPNCMSGSCDLSSTVTMDLAAIRQGAYVTAAFVLIFYACIVGQTLAKHKTAASYRARGERLERYYNVTDKDILAWDRIVGNLLEQAMPFLTLFWANIGLAALGYTSHTGVAIAGWTYVAFRALYPVAWLSGGGGRAGPRNKILFVTPAMYLVVVYLFANMLWAVRSR